MNSRNKGKVGEREFAELLRQHGFEARRGQQFSGGADSPDVVCEALDWLHIEVKRVEQLNLAEACAQAKRDQAKAGLHGHKKTAWIVAHRRNHTPWMITLDSEALYGLLRQSLSHFDLWPFAGPRLVTLDAELFFQFLREIQRRRFTDEHGYVLPPEEATRINTPDLSFKGGHCGRPVLAAGLQFKPALKGSWQTATCPTKNQTAEPNGAHGVIARPPNSGGPEADRTY